MMHTGRRTAFAVSLLLATCLGQANPSPASNQDTIPATERKALLALYAATDGEHWKDHEGWLGAPGTECEWEGVSCGQHQAGDPLAVTGIQLSENDLKGAVPVELAELTHLEYLTLFGNHLTRGMPEPLIRRWLSGSLWIAAEDPLLTDVSEIDFESAASSILCASSRIVLRSDTSMTYFAERCRNTNPEDRTTFCEIKQGRSWPRQFAKLAWLLNDDGFYELRHDYDRSVTEGTFESTRVIRDGKKYEVVNYADAGPFNLWAIQRSIMGSIEGAGWVSTKRQPKCPRWDESKIEHSAAKR